MIGLGAVVLPGVARAYEAADARLRFGAEGARVAGIVVDREAVRRQRVPEGEVGQTVYTAFASALTDHAAP